MANYNSTANVVLSVNGKQAEKVLSALQNQASKLERQIAKAATAGDKATMKKLQRELSSTNRLMSQLQGSANTAEQVLRRLDRATPKDLQKTLRTLQSQLNGIERGSAAWNEHINKIRRVKEEISAVNRQLAVQQSRWQRLNNWLNNAQTMIMGAAAALTGLVLAGRKAVNAYAEMDAEMANVRKFTGMTAEQVAQLNEEFKKIDTRTSREDLNRLAQEAGRLGKTSQEDVLGFVRAADQINVALDDLGDGATLTLSKLTNIFGDEKRLGTEKALLAVGSVINELSQNCTASAPYLANFAQRMAGVGAQAKMSIPEIMGFAAVLDSQGQAVEMSATAVSKLVMDMFKEKDRIIKAVGLDAQEFNASLKRSTNEGLLMLLDKLHELGNMDALAPVFKDMGENGARASQVISALAGNLDMVRWEQEEAAKAFEEGTSVTKEFTVQNTTVQAGLDKAKKRVTELAVELGEKLHPVMKYVYSSTGVFLRVLNQLVSFFIKYRREIATLAAAVAAYTVVTRGSAMVTAAWGIACKAASAAAAIARSGVMALRVAYYALTGQITRANAITKVFNRTNAKSPWGIVIALVTAAIGAIMTFTSKAKEAKEQAERQRRELEQWRKNLTDLDDTAAQYAASEENRLKRLYDAATDEAKSVDDRRTAAERLQSLYTD